MKNVLKKLFLKYIKFINFYDFMKLNIISCIHCYKLSYNFYTKISYTRYRLSVTRYKRFLYLIYG